MGAISFMRVPLKLVLRGVLGLDVAVSIDGDGQMDTDEMIDLIEPIVAGDADYTKGNRLLDADQWDHIPRIRFFGNAVLSLLTKPSRHEVDVPYRYVGFEVPDVFVIGYGLDFAERYRELPFIGTLRADLVPA